MSFIEDFLLYTSGYESPKSFWVWSSYAGVAAALRDNVYLPQRDRKLYPNIYVVLLAESAAHRKSTPAELVTKLVIKVGNTKVISGRSSIQAIIDDLANVQHNKTSGRPIKGGSALFSAPELASSLVEDPAAIKVLTDIYDFKEEWTSSLKSSGKSVISNLCFTMLAASNDSFLKTVFTTTAVYGGLLGRTFIIKPDEFRASNSLFSSNGNLQLDPVKLIQDLKEIAKLQGVFKVSPEAERAYNEWYDPFRQSYKEINEKSGVIGRIHTGVIKVAMILAAGHRRELVIRKEDILTGIDECLKLLPNYEALTMSSGKASIAESGAILMNELWIAENHIIKRRDLLRNHWADLDAETLDKLVQTLEQAGIIKCYMLSSVGEMTYEMTPDGLDLCKSKLKTKDEMKAKGKGAQ